MIIFSDFDGTAAVNDVGDLLFRTFGDADSCLATVQAWIQGEISSRECLEREAAAARATRAQLEAFCDTQSLSPGFVEFTQWCRQRDLPLIVLSDGLDFYIRRIFARYGVELPVYSNRLELVPPDRLSISFPYLEHTCGRCANCKGHHLRSLPRNGEMTVYIGDGYSDRCGAVAADVVIAKHDLAEWCKANQVEYHSFDDFHQVSEIVKDVFGTGRR